MFDHAVFFSPLVSEPQKRGQQTGLEKGKLDGSEKTFRRRPAEAAGEIELKLTEGNDVLSACRCVGISDTRQYKRRKRFGGMRRLQLSEMHGLEKENARLNNIVDELGLDKLSPKESMAQGSAP